LEVLIGPIIRARENKLKKEEDTNIIRGIPQIYNENRNIKQQMATC
jgi:hypothetical protein